uniref:C2H2-type domain-containing protein n=1 Tax=Trichogramma kaykai TaxID=54128 RepID=A0ABD2XDQ1_9HYME
MRTTRSHNGFASSLVKLADLQSAISDQNSSVAVTSSVIGDLSAAGELNNTTTTTIVTAAVTAETNADRPPPPRANNWRIKITQLPQEKKTLYTCIVCPDDDQRPTFDCIKECKVHLREIHADAGYTCFCVLCGILLDTDELLLAHMEQSH